MSMEEKKMIWDNPIFCVFWILWEQKIIKKTTTNFQWNRWYFAQYPAETHRNSLSETKNERMWNKEVKSNETIRTSRMDDLIIIVGVAFW